MKKLTLVIFALFLVSCAFSQRKENISIDRYYHIRKGSLWFHSIGLNFQPVTMGDIKTEIIYMYNSSDEEVTLTVDDLPAGYSVVFEPEILKPKSEGIAKITLNTKENGVYGPAINYFFIETSLLSERPYRILVSPNIHEDFSAITEEMRTAGPKIEFSNTVIDFGELPQMSVYHCEFEFRNAGKSALYIRNVKAGCGCTITQTSRDTLLPGESALLKVEFRSGHKKGNQDNKITVVSNDPDHPQVLLHITGIVLTPDEEKTIEK